MSIELIKYPRTHHIESSKIQPGDEDLDQVSFGEIAERNLVVEEKVDGSNSGICFDSRGTLKLQSRGHFLRGGGGEFQFNLFKQWAPSLRDQLLDVLKDRYVMFGEWTRAVHTIFYDRLPHYFLEFDIYDREEDVFLSTPRRKEMISNLPIHSVPVLHQGEVNSLNELRDFHGESNYASDDPASSYHEILDEEGISMEAVDVDVELSGRMEGLYIKVEEQGRVQERYKWISSHFYQRVQETKEHWKNRVMIPNKLSPDVNISDFYKTEPNQSDGND